MEYLRKELEGIKITPQYAVGRTKADLVVGDSVIVEIKTDLKSTGQVQRLKGQLTDYAEWKGRVLVLLTGKTDPDLKMALQKFVDEENGRMKHLDPLAMFGSGKIRILQK